MGLIRRLRKTRKLYKDHKAEQGKIPHPDTDAMVSTPTLYAFRAMMFCFFLFAVVHPGYAPPKAPKLPEGFCEHGDVTATTGECMCHWQHKDGCVGSGCEYQMGLSFYHYSCKDCKCVKEP